MIICDRYKYLFIQVPQTACSAIAKELVDNYNGEPILRKHSNYYDFIRIAKETQKRYFSFCGVRNPLDSVVSTYVKHKKNHQGGYTNQKRLKVHGGWVTKRELEMFKFTQNETHSFGGFLKRFYRQAYTSNADVNRPYCDFVIRYENLNDDFSLLLQKIGIKQCRPLPTLNTTEGKQDYLQYYTDQATKRYAVKTFGPFMRQWGYEFPADWPSKNYGYFAMGKYNLLTKLRIHYFKWYKRMPERNPCR